MKPTTREQREALYRLYQRYSDSIRTASVPTFYCTKSGIQRYRLFRRSFFNNGQWLGGFLPLAYGHDGQITKKDIYFGIEPDGYTHT